MKINFQFPKKITLILIFIFLPDGLTDCADSKCCSHPSCVRSMFCVSLADPTDVLLVKPPPSPTASFYQRVSFLFDGQGTVQTYVDKNTLKQK